MTLGVETACPRPQSSGSTFLRDSEHDWQILRSAQGCQFSRPRRARSTAFQIIKDEGFEGQMTDKISTVTARNQALVL